MQLVRVISVNCDPLERSLSVSMSNNSQDCWTYYALKLQRFLTAIYPCPISETIGRDKSRGGSLKHSSEVRLYLQHDPRVYRHVESVDPDNVIQQRYDIIFTLLNIQSLASADKATPIAISIDRPLRSEAARASSQPPPFHLGQWERGYDVGGSTRRLIG